MSAGRILLAVLLATAVVAAEYAPSAGQIQLYKWHVGQTAEWSSAGDHLKFETAIDWSLALDCVAVDGPRMRLAVTFLDVHATHRGPGVDIVVDSKSGAGTDDPLLGHLIALAGKTLAMEVERATGMVTTVTGGDAIIAAINQRSPSLVPGDPPPLDAAAHAAYGPDALARLWTQVLALPGQTPAQRVALPPPFTAGATIERTWTGLAWKAAVPADAKPPAFELSRDPTPVTGEVRQLTGSGTVELLKGLPGHNAATMGFTLAMQALTQPVLSVHTLQWQLDAQ